VLIQQAFAPYFEPQTFNIWFSAFSIAKFHTLPQLLRHIAYFTG